MAKWIYEKWSIKWDDTEFTPMTGTTQVIFSMKVDIVTMVASKASSVAVGDAALSSLRNMNKFNSGEDVYMMYVTSVSRNTNGSYVGRYKFKSGVGANKSWLANQRIKDTRQADVILEEGTVPDDGIHTDGYWYVKVKKVFPDIKIVNGTTLKTATSAYVVQGGVLKSVTDMYVVQDGQIKKVR